MSEATNAQLAVSLRALSESFGVGTESRMNLRLAAQRLEAREVSENDKPPFEQACRTYSGPEPQDCNWPFCGCDDRANKVVETLQECGYADPDEAHRLRSLNAKLRKALQSYLDWWDEDGNRAPTLKDVEEKARAALEAAMKG
jgi:hypothetical protein